MLESLSSLFESLATGDPNLHELSVDSREDLIPSLRKIRKLSGMFYHLLNYLCRNFWLDYYLLIY